LYEYVSTIISSPVFGHALEIEIIPPHTCPFNCIHCRYGKIRNNAIDPIEYFSPQELIDKFCRTSRQDSSLDRIVLGGKGEPLLYSGIKILIDGLRRIYRVPIAVASCGTLLWKERIRNVLLNADIVMASLDASDATTFNCVNRPHGNISYALFIQGLLDFSTFFKGDLWLQVHLLDGITAIKSEVLKIASVVDKINPKKIFIRTPWPSPPEDFAFPVDNKQMQYFKNLFSDRATVIE
jgi:wyosine [tRNA(Phe)-imidazoG37] synthetase (radical SAM superfamily)